MKKILLLIVLFASQMMSAQNGFSVYEDDGLYGIRFNGETCLLPRFSQITLLEPLFKGEGYKEYYERNGKSYYDYSLKFIKIPNDVQQSIFFFKDNGKWGIANIWEIIAPSFCDSLTTFSTNKNVYRFKSGSKWGVCNILGETVISPTFDSDSISIFDSYYKGCAISGEVREKYLVNDYKNIYFRGKVNGKEQMFDILGTPISIQKKWLKWDSMTEILGLKMDTEKKRAKADKKKGFITTKQLQFQMNRLDSLYKVHSLIVDKNNYPFKLYFGERGGKRIEAQGDSVIINGYPSLINSFGFISMPLNYCSTKDRLIRNPFDVYALCGYVSEEAGNAPYNNSRSIPAQEKRIEYYSGLSYAYKEILSQIDKLTDNNAYNYVYYQYAKAEENIGQSFKQIGHIEYEEKKAQRREALYNNLMSFANSLATTASILQGNSSSAYTSPASSSSYSSSTSRKETTPSSNSTMSLSDARNYQVQRNTYNKWASDLMQMKNANGKYQNGYTQSDKQHAQSEMKRIRENAKQRWGKEIPYNSIEDWR